MTIKPTVLGTVAPAGVGAPTASLLPAVTPVTQVPVLVGAEQALTSLNDDDQEQARQVLAGLSIEVIALRDIALLGSPAEQSLHRTLDGFLGRIDQFSNPELFKLFEGLNQKVEAENLPALAEKILNQEPSLWVRFISLFNPKRLAKAKQFLFEEARRLASGKTKTLSDVVATMERQLAEEQTKLVGEIQAMEQLKEAYRNNYLEFCIAVAVAEAFLARSKEDVVTVKAGLDLTKVEDKILSDELDDKLQALESRSLALQGTLARLPADHEVIRQIQVAGVGTLQEVSTTASSRFASIKMTLLSLHGALSVRGLQKLAQQGADLDANLQGVREMMVKDVVTTAANAPGDNRLAQAEQLKAVVASARELATIVQASRENNQKKFATARTMFAEAQKEMLALGRTRR